jgi:hypothetical protein
VNYPNGKKRREVNKDPERRTVGRKERMRRFSTAFAPWSSRSIQRKEILTRMERTNRMYLIGKVIAPGDYSPLDFLRVQPKR